MVLSYIVGQKKNPIPYPMKDIAIYVIATAVLYAVMKLLPASWPAILTLAVNTLLILLFTALIVKKDLPLSSLPIIGKKFKR